MTFVAPIQRLLFRRHDDGQGTIRLGQGRIFILPSRGGLLFALALIVMLIGAINYNLSLGHALVFLLAGIGIVGMLHTVRNLYGLQITPGRCPPVFAGEQALFELVLENDRHTPRRAIAFSTRRGPSVTAAVDALGQQKIRLPVQAIQRGWLDLPDIRVTSRYPLGLFTAWSNLYPARRCLVYPQPMASPLPEAQPSQAGGERSGQGGQEDFAGFRARQPADSLHHVAWKASARDAGERPLLIKQFSGGTDSELCLDWQDTAEFSDSEVRISILTGWILAADALGTAYSLALPGLRVPAASGEAHRLHCLEVLALYQP